MARKKTAETASLKAAPVLRSQGEDPAPETPTTITKSYCVRDDWKDNGTVNYVAFKSVDGEVQDLTVNGEPAGGGGGSIETVDVTVTNNYRSSALVTYITARTNDGKLTPNRTNISTGQTTVLHNMAVMGDKIVFKTDDARTLAVASGSAQLLSNHEAVILGTCTLTIS